MAEANTASPAPESHDLRVPYNRALIKSAPSVERDDHLSPTEEEELYRHYSPQGTTTANTGTTTKKTSQGQTVTEQTREEHIETDTDRTTR